MDKKIARAFFAIAFIILSLRFAALTLAQNNRELESITYEQNEGNIRESDRVRFQPGLVRVDISITTSSPTNWEGEISLSQGVFKDLVCLGSRASSPTDFLYSDSRKNCLDIYTRSPSTFCGVETTLIAPRDSSLNIKLRDRTQDKTLNKTISVGRLVVSSIKIPFDEYGNGIEISRAPADELPILIESLQQNGSGIVAKETTVFHPSEVVRLSVLPRSSSSELPDDMVLSITARKSGESEPFWVNSREITLSEIQRAEALLSDPTVYPESYGFSFAPPQTEGVFEIQLELASKETSAPKSTFALPPTRRKSERVVFARRSIQGIVVNSDSRQLNQPNASNDSIGNIRAELLETIDPTNTSWRKVFSKRANNLFHPNTNKEEKSKNPITLPFLSTDSENGERPTTTFAQDAYQPNSNRTFDSESSSNIPPSDVYYPVVTPNDNGVVGKKTLAQAPNIKNSGEGTFGKNLLGFVPRLNSKETISSREVDENRFLERWEQDRFQSFTRGLTEKNFDCVNNLWDYELSSGHSRVFTKDELDEFAAPQSRFLRLAPNTPQEPSWEAYPIPIDEPGKPYVLEIEYPTNLPQKLGISIIERSVTGGIFPSSRDLGISVSNDPLSDRPANEVARYTTVFWPQTRTPIVLLINSSSETEAAYGHIRIYRTNEIRPTSSQGDRGRIFGAAMTKPNLVNQFGRTKSASYFGVTGAETWESFDESIQSTLQSLSISNVDSLMLSVMSDGSSLYPSARLNPSTKYDKSVFLTAGGDPVRKDALSALLTKFDAYNKRVVPIVNFNAPLPFLEEKLSLLRSGKLPTEVQKTTEGIEWIGAGGKKLIDSRLSASGTGPYYNILHPIVEKETLTIIKELLDKCNQHASFNGLALEIGADGWLSLPDDVFFGMDDETIARFVRESNLQEKFKNSDSPRVRDLILASGTDRYKLRADFIRVHCLTEWIEWRISAANKFYNKIRSLIAESRPDARLYLVTTNALNGEYCQSLLLPSLTSGKKIREALRLIGLDPIRFVSDVKKRNATAVKQVGYLSDDVAKERVDNSVVMLRPEIIAETAVFSQSIQYKEFNDPSVISLFCGSQSVPGTFFFHKTQRVPVYKFNQLSPIKPAIVEIQSQLQPAGYENLRRFARTLAVEDTLVFFDGGEFLQIVCENSLREWINVFKSLPNVTFKNWSPKSDINTNAENENNAEALDDKTIQPLVVRYYRSDRETWIYLLNAAPFHLGVNLELKKRIGASFEKFSGEQYEAPTAFKDSLVWNFTASPYDLVAIKIDDPKVMIEKIEVSRPSEICGPDGRLNIAVQNFVERLLAARSGVAFPLRNGDFEESLDNNTSTTESTSNSIELQNDSKDPKAGKNNIFHFEKDNLPNFPTFKRANKSDSDSRTANNSEYEEEQNQIQGWRSFGEKDDVSVELDRNVFYSGSASLKISSRSKIGGVVCQPFAPPTTGRLCVQVCFGVPENVQDLSLNICLIGKRNGIPFVRRIPLGAALMKRVQNFNKEDSINGAIWIRDAALFDKLPIDGLSNLSLRFELCNAGTIWIDQIRLYKLAFADAEQTELMKIINNVEYRASKERLIDVLYMLDSYWAKMLEEQIPDDSLLLVSRNRRPATTAALPEKEEPAKNEKKRFFNRTLERLKLW